LTAAAFLNSPGSGMVHATARFLFVVPYFNGCHGQANKIPVCSVPVRELFLIG